MEEEDRRQYETTTEVNRICDYLGRYPTAFSRELMQLQVGGGVGAKDRGTALKERSLVTPT